MSAFDPVQKGHFLQLFFADDPYHISSEFYQTPLRKPYAFLTDYSTCSLLFIAFLGAPWLMQQKGHTYIDLIPNALSVSKRHKWMGCIEILVAVICAVVTYVGILVTQDAIRNATRLTDTFGTPKWILLICIPIGCLFTAIQCIRCAVEDFKGTEGGEA